MRRFAPYALLPLCTLILGLLSCSSSTDPAEEEPSGPELLVEDTIGAAGGTLTAGDVAVAIPEEMLASDTAMGLYRADRSDYGDYGATDLIELRGLGSVLAGTVTVTLPSLAKAPVDTALIGVRMWNPDDPTDIGTWRFVQVLNVDGTFSAEVPVMPEFLFGPPDPSAVKNFERWYLQFIGLVEMRTILVPDPENTLFAITYPKHDDPYILDIREALYAGYLNYTNLGFQTGYAGMEDFRWNGTTVLVNPFTRRADLPRVAVFSKPYAYSATSDALLMRAYADIDDTEVTPANLPRLAEEIMREMFNSVHAAADPFLDAPQLREAIKIWSEPVLGTVEVAPAFPGQEARPLHGYTPHEGDMMLWASCSEGIGYASLIEYMEEHPELGLDNVTDLLPQLIAAEGDEEEAIVAAIGAPPAVWWPDYVRRLIAGDLYPVQDSAFLADVAGTFTVAGSGDTLRTFDHAYLDLQATPFRIDLARDDFHPDHRLSLTTAHGADAGAVTLLLYGLQGGTLSYLDQGTSLDLPGLDVLQAAGTDLVVFVCNGDLGNTAADPLDIALTARVHGHTEAGDHVVFQQDRVDISCRVLQTRTCTGPGCAESEWTTSETLNINDAEGTWNGTTFSSNWNRYYPPGSLGGERTVTGSVTIEAAADGLSLVSIQGTVAVTYPDEAYDTLTIGRTGAGTAVPEYEDPFGYNAGYVLLGDDVCTGLTVAYVDDGYHTVQIADYTCAGIQASIAAYFDQAD